MTTISGVPPLRPPGPHDPTITPGRTPTTATPTPVPPTALGVDTVAYDAIVAMVTRAIAGLPPGMALSSFIATVARVTAEVEAQLADRPAAGQGDAAAPVAPGALPTNATTTLPEAIARHLAATLAAADPAAARAGIADLAGLPSPTPAEVSARDLALAAAAMLGGRIDPDRPMPDPTRIAPDPDADPFLSEQPMRDRLYLLDPIFDDPAYPGRSFYCRDCITLDGLLARFPDKASLLDVIRIPYPRPRDAVIAVAGEANQNLPLLVLAPGADPALADGRHGDTNFVSDLKGLLHALHVRHGFPEAHP